MNRLPRLVALFALAGLLAGCGKQPPEATTVWLPPQKPYQPSASSGNAFDGYLIAAQMARRQAPDAMSRVHFTRGMRSDILSKVSPALVTLQDATNRPCEFEFRAVRPFEPRPHQAAWRLLGRCLAWAVESAANEGQLDRAITWCLVGTRFGIDLTGGGASDASLGYTIASDVRRAIAPHLGVMSPAQLQRLADGAAHALARAPGAKRTVANEGLNMRAAVQYVHDVYRAGKVESLHGQLLREGREAVDYLARMPESEAAAYFGGFAAEADDEVRQQVERARHPTARRPKHREAEGEYRPWKRFSKHFFLSARPILDLDDVFVARTRLLILTCRARAAVLRKGSAPADLGSVPAELKLDPFSGDQLGYRAEGVDFRIYSVGRNLTDDGGDTDENGEAPDLVLEGTLF